MLGTFCTRLAPIFDILEVELVHNYLPSVIQVPGSKAVTIPSRRR